MKVAFYKADGEKFDGLIRGWTHSKYSHCEIVFRDGMFFSASPRDRGVRYKVIEQDPAVWDFVEIQIDVFDENKVRRWCDTKVGKGYDWMGIFLSQILPLGIDDPGRYFCSEVIVAALQQVGRFKGIKASSINQQKLYDMTK